MSKVLNFHMLLGPYLSKVAVYFRYNKFEILFYFGFWMELLHFDEL
jgi:hypothetical protein